MVVAERDTPVQGREGFTFESVRWGHWRVRFNDLYLGDLFQVTDVDDHPRWRIGSGDHPDFDSRWAAALALLERSSAPTATPRPLGTVVAPLPFLLDGRPVRTGDVVELLIAHPERGEGGSEREREVWVPGSFRAGCPPLLEVWLPRTARTVSLPLPAEAVLRWA